MTRNWLSGDKFARAASRRSLLAAAGLIVLLLVLAFLQQRWLHRLSEYEETQLRRNLSSTAGRFAEDFDRELTRLALVYLPSSFSKSEQELTDHLEEASRKLITINSGVDLVGRTFLLNRSGIKPVGRNGSHLIPAHNSWMDDLRHSRKLPSLIGGNFPAIVFPLHAFQQDNSAWLIVECKKEAIQTALIHPLLKKHFGEKYDSEFQFAVTDNHSRVFFRSPDSSNEISREIAADIFRLRFDSVLFLSSETTGRESNEMIISSSTQGPQKDTTIDNVEVSIKKKGQFEKISRWKHSASSGSSTMLVAPQRWFFVVQDARGPLNAVVARGRYRNLLLGSGTLALLTVSVLLLIRSVRHAQNVAHQQLNFVAGVSHELRTPLSIIRSAAENLADAVVIDSQKIREYGRLIHSEGQKLTGMVDRILEFTRNLSHGTNNFGPVDLRTVIEKAISATVASAQNSHHFHCEVALGENHTVRGDAVALQSAIQNLVDNAIKYTGWFSLQARIKSQNVEIIVEDRGPGIPPKDLPHIFEPFYRGKETGSLQIRGSGLGLSIVRQVVRKHGGHVEAFSKKEGGSRFIIRLPLQK